MGRQATINRAGDRAICVCSRLFSEKWCAQMRKAVGLFVETKWTVLITVLLTILVGHIAGHQAIVLYNQNAPIIEMTGTLVSHDGHSAVIHVKGKKLRDCRFEKLTAMYKLKSNGLLVDANLARVGDLPPADGTRPVGDHDLGLWRIWPTDDAVRVMMFVQHTCGKETVMSKLAEVDLGKI